MDIQLSKNDLRWAHWRNIPSEKKPKSAPFDIQVAIEKIKQVKAKPRKKLSLQSLNINLSMSKQEAHFWLEVFIIDGSHWDVTGYQIIAELDETESAYHGNLTLADIRTMLGTVQSYYLSYGILVPVYVLLSPTDFVQIVPEFFHLRYQSDTLAELFRLNILPYITTEERDIYRSAIKPHIKKTNQAMIAFGGLIGGCDEELCRYLDFLSPPDNPTYHYIHNAADFYAVFGLSDPEKVMHYIRTLQLVLYPRNHMLAWLAHTELQGLDWLAYSVQQRTSKKDKKTAFNIFKKLECVEAVPHVLELWQDPQLAGEALSWLVKNPDMTAEALTPIALSDAPHAQLAQQYLRRMVSMGQTEILEGMLTTLDADAQERFTSNILEFYDNDVPEFGDDDTPQWLTDAIAGQSKKISAAVKWVDILALPSLTIEGKRLNAEQVQRLLMALKDNHAPMLNGVREHVSQQERDDFMWALYESWESNGAPSKGKWTFDSLGKLGGDTIVLKLIPLLKKWPGESKHRRASDGIKVLQEIGTDTALMQINNLAQKIRYKSLKRTAQTAMENIAKARGLSQAELEDRIIPDCGLDADGTRVFDYGPRQFTFLLSHEMKPLVRDEAKNKIRTNLPKPNKKDDEGLSAQAQADWKLVKKQVRDVAKIQAERLEQAMISQRRWTLDDFMPFYVQHPMMFHIVRLLVWGGYDATGALSLTFRVDEDHQLVDTDDEPIDTTEIVTVGVIHVMEMEADSQQEWGDVLSDYEIIAPFQQLSRKVSTLEPGECEAKILTRFAPHKVEPVVLISILEKSGWERGAAMDGGMYYSHAKYYPFADVTALVRYDGVAMGYWDMNHQGVNECFFLKGNQGAEGYKEYKEEQMMTLQDVPPVVLSETLRTLIAIASKAE